MAPRQKLFATSWGLFDPTTLGRVPKVLDSLKALGYSGVETPIGHALA
jgi:sugar phosphate isomerase/epimerase